MERISSAILEKVKLEAQGIIKEAEEKARAGVKQAKEQHKARIEEEKGKSLSAANAEASRLLAQAAIQARQEMLAAKTGVIDKIIVQVKKSLTELPEREKILLALTGESVNALNTGSTRAYVASRDMDTMKKLVREDKELARTITEIGEYDCLGGVIIEDAEGKNRIDNTFESRLEMLLPRILPEIGKELF